MIGTKAGTTPKPPEGTGKKFDGDPQFAANVNDKLYLFLNEDIFGEFHKDTVGTIAKAEANWKKIRSAAATGL